MPDGPRIDVVGLGPAGPELITAGALAVLASAAHVFLRTGRHPAAEAVGGARTFDHHYERSDTFEDVYRSIVDDLIDAATKGGTVAYAVPGSPTVAERTVVLLAGHPRVVSGEVALEVHPSVSFLDIAFARLGVDPIAAGVRLVDAEQFALDAAGERGPLLVAQCWSRQVLSDVKLSVESAPDVPVTVLHHLGLPDERIEQVPWTELDRSVEPDHLTSLWIPRLGAPVAAELVALDELVR
ncbi:MAG TPA: SAM-dependent methyltransferase, partial [Acidimicrobiales bacterium]